MKKFKFQCIICGDTGALYLVNGKCQHCIQKQKEADAVFEYEKRTKNNDGFKPRRRP